MNAFSLSAALRIALIVGAPLLLAVVELFHPHPGDLLDLDAKTWLAVHYAQILLFPLSALAVSALVNNQAGVAATVCRVAMFVFAISFVAFDSAAGVVTGILVDGISIFRTHAWPGGPLTFGGMAIAAGWLLWERQSLRNDTR